MSSPLAIAAVTATLKNLLVANLSADLPNADQFTTKPPDIARGANTGDQINLFLYHLMPNAAWRNMDLPKQVRPGEHAPPALALILDYLITAYGDKDHRLLGEAMSALHDYPLLNPADIQAALEEAGLHQQVERVRLTLQPLSLEDMYRLWNGFQTQYRVSAAYQISVVLIESKLLSRASLPVLKRGSDDRGVTTVAGGNPSLSELILPKSQSSVRLGDTIVIRGTNVGTDGVMVRFFHPSLAAPIEIAPTAGDNAGEIQVTLPDTVGAISQWVPGLFTLSLVVRRPLLPAWTSNELPAGLAPVITRTPAVAPAASTLTVTSTPRIRDGQRVKLILGDRQVDPASITNDPDLTKPTQIDFVVPSVPLGNHVIRLRVDGIDSIPVILSGVPPKPAFDPAQTVTV